MSATERRHQEIYIRVVVASVQNGDSKRTTEAEKKKDQRTREGVLLEEEGRTKLECGEARYGDR